MMRSIKNIAREWLIPPGLWQSLVNLRARPVALHTSEERALLASTRQLRDRHQGERCFILAAGSSIGQQDLKKLAGEYVISVSNTFVHPDYELIKPQYHVLPHLLRGHGRLRPAESFVEWLRQMESKTGNAEMFMHIGDKGLVDQHALFKGRVIHWNEYVPWDGKCQSGIDLASIPSIWSVSEYAISVALYLGFDEIYLLGFDHDWFNGLFVYFYDHNTEHAMKPDADALAYVDSEFQMRRHADILKKYKCLREMKHNIYNANANPNTYVDVFPKVDYDSLFEGQAKA